MDQIGGVTSPVPFTQLGELQWSFTVTPDLANPMGALYGGAPLAGAIDLVEDSFDMATRWATIRFLHGAAIGDELTVTARVDVDGRRTKHCTVTGVTDDRTVFEVMLGIGSGRAEALNAQYLAMPDAPSPEDVPTSPVRPDLVRTAVVRAERRQAYGVSPFGGETQPDGRIGLWARMPDGDSSSRPSLAWLADCMPLGIAAATGRMPAGVSLDNTIRFGRPATSEWVLLDISAEAADHGYAYGTVHCWAPDGTLLGTGTQTAIIRDLF